MTAQIFFKGVEVTLITCDEVVRITDHNLILLYTEYIKDKKLIAQFDGGYAFVLFLDEAEQQEQNKKLLKK